LTKILGSGHGQGQGRLASRIKVEKFNWLGDTLPEHAPNQLTDKTVMSHKSIST